METNEPLIEKLQVIIHWSVRALAILILNWVPASLSNGRSSWLVRLRMRRQALREQM